MRPVEARYIGSLLNSLDADQLSPAINLGSSTLHFRRVAQPHIEKEIFEPLRRRGIKVVHADLKAAEGVDVVGNIYDAQIKQTIVDVGAKLVICCNIIEHVTDPAEFMRICASLVRPGGKLLVTVPFSYPYHPDPIDTYLRPSPVQVARLIEGFELIDARVLKDTTYLQDLRREKSLPQLARYFAIHLAKFLWPFSDFSAWRARYHRYLWLFRPYQTSCVLLTKV
jgi:SAM-dependent methyltransferase